MSKKDKMTLKNGKKFWGIFKENAQQISEFITNKRLSEAFNFVDTMLNNCGFDLAFELAGKPGEFYIIFSPEGDYDEAKRIDDFIGIAPKIDAWRIFGRKPRKPMPDPFVFVEKIYGIWIDDCMFDINQLNDKLIVNVYSSFFSEFDYDVAYGCAATLLFHMLGEDFVMDYIDEINPITESHYKAIPPEDFIKEIDAKVQGKGVTH